MLLTLLGALVAKVLWVGMLLLFFAGSVTYAFNPPLGRELLQRSLVMMILLLLIRVVLAS